ncbi:hypothetical protein [Nocardia goodfellowii]|uniref:Uncharacterized protein n=1 Tax=Nocardia goodfellowii TaxID=882446 RepID=A0ABS4QES2_9NOCA|nr:hypothetical protein [Nocardia goodfellowii]MBP2190199.1 hypothetical protein [Nocardia goodfellowii]
MTLMLEGRANRKPAAGAGRHDRCHRFRGGGLVLAMAGAMTALFTSVAPAADAIPVSVLAHTQKSSASAAPLTGAGLTVDLAAALDLESQGITANAGKPAQEVDGGIQLPVDEGGSKLQYENKRIVGGTIVLDGAIELAKGEEKLTISSMKYDFESGALTATVGDEPGMAFGAVIAHDNVEVVLPGETTKATLKLANQGIKLDAGFIAAVDKAFGTNLSTDIDTDAGIDANLEADVDLAKGNELNADLIVALGLDSDIDLDGGVEGLQGAVLDLDIDLL